ncbi:MAG: VOC family protein [Candidatus Andersenbacteria bacterium]
MQLSKAPASVQIRIADHAATRAFYEGKLGLKHTDLGPEVPALYEAGNGTIIVAYSGKPTHPESTIGNFQVDDVEATVKELQAKGVTFEEYDLPDMKTVNGIVDWEGYKVAWFKDPDGYIWSVNPPYKK